MAIVVEDGTIVADANSYVTLVEARAYALARGITLSLVDADVNAFLIKAADYLEAQRARYQGLKVDSAQELQFPREEVYIDGSLLDYTAIPKCLKYAQMQLVIEQHNGVDIMPTRNEGFVVEDTVGPITTKYSDKVATSAEPELTAVDALLAPLFLVKQSGFFLTTYRA